MRPALPAALMLLVATLMAGCALPGASGSGTAKSLESRASPEAQDWDSDAELIAIIGVEGRFNDEDAGDMGDWADAEGIRQMLDRAQSDDNVGDGKCEFWAYAYRAEGKDEALIVVVNRTGGDPWVIQMPHEDGDEQLPIGDFDIDSDEALKIAKEESEDLRTTLERENVGVMEALGRNENHPNPAWVIMAGGGDMEGGDMGFVIVDAKTGEVIAQFGWGDMMGGDMGGWGR